MKNLMKLLTFVLFLFICTTLKAEIKMPAIFNNNMVLQQQTKVAVWGWATPNSNVTVTGSWDNKQYNTKSDKDGKWKLYVQTPNAGFTPYTLIISDGKELTLSNILIGEVWICSGQSNMDMPMKGYTSQPVANSAEYIQNSKNDNIRLFTVKMTASPTPKDDCEGDWMSASHETVSKFSATAYFFGRRIFNDLNVPVGLIHTSKGGSSIVAWMDENTAKKFPTLQLPEKNKDIPDYNRTPTGLYNAMINPIKEYGMRGAIWYQGEADINRPTEYISMFAEMVGQWRKDWQLGDFPFYYVQIAPYKYPEVRSNSAFMREAQMKCMDIVPNTGMAVIMDADSPTCIHPPKKKDAGERLALWALAKTYGKDIVHKSPQVSKTTVEGRLMTIAFDMPNSPGLTSYDKDLKSFLIAGEDKRFYPAIAGLNGNKVFVFSPRVAKPVAVRYAFEDRSEAEIFTVEGELPLSSFRTDNW